MIKDLRKILSFFLFSFFVVTILTFSEQKRSFVNIQNQIFNQKIELDSIRKKLDILKKNIIIAEDSLKKIQSRRIVQKTIYEKVIFVNFDNNDSLRVVELSKLYPSLRDSGLYNIRSEKRP